MRWCRILPFILLSAQSISSAQDSTATWLPGGVTFPPLMANAVEARNGFVVLRQEHRLRLDIGNSIDILRIPVAADPGLRMTIGADFFTWTSLRQAEHFHFPVDAVDYLFGVNTCLRYPIDESWGMQGRLRVSHISAHLVDGSYDKTLGAWKDGRLPRVYSREFVELTVAGVRSDALRAFVDFEYVYHVDPADLGTIAVASGCEAAARRLLAEWATPYIAYYVQLSRVGAWRASHSTQVGITFGTWEGRGINLFIAAFHGFSQHGEYFDRVWSYWGPGMTIDF